MIIPPANRLNTVEEYYFSQKLRQIRELQASGKNIINLGIGSPDLAPAPQVIDALYNTAQQDNTHGYQSYTGIPELRYAMSNWYKRTYKVELNPDNEILPLMGSKEGIMHLSMAFLNTQDAVLVPNPGYPTYSSVSNLLEAKTIYYPLTEKNNWQPDWDFLENTDLSGVKLMWTSYPNMPTGANGSLSLFEQLVRFAHKHRILLVNDNPYSLILNPKPISILQVDGAKEVALELNSLSKSHNMAGWRVGMVAGSADYISNILKVKSNMDSGMFLGIQQAAIAALQLPLSWHEEQNNIYQSRRYLANQIADELNCTYDAQQVGMFLWAKVPDVVNNVGDFVDNILHNAHVFITPGFIFGSAGERYIRLSLCSPIEKFIEAHQRIKHINKI